LCTGIAQTSRDRGTPQNIQSSSGGIAILRCVAARIAKITKM
jgi:hypothetical protein